MPNAFEAGSRKVIPAVLVYLEREGELLMLHRTTKPGDYHAGKYNGLGGKLEVDESPAQGAARECLEEAGVTLEPGSVRCLGVLQFPNFKAHKSEDWVVWVFTAELPLDARPWSEGPEGRLVWVHKEKLLELNLWPGDRHFLPYVVQGRPFHGTIWYEGESVRRYCIEPLGDRK